MELGKQKGKMKNTEKILKFDLGVGSSAAQLIMKRDGQEKECESNCILLHVELRLPAYVKGSNTYLDGTGFGNRLNIFQEGLCTQWGYEGESGGAIYRWRAKKFTGTLWESLFEEAEEYGRAEVKKIINAIEQRKIALEEAEG